MRAPTLPRLLAAACLAPAAFVPALLSAQDVELDVVPETSPEEFVEAENAWDFGLRAGVSASFGDSRAVVGQPDGSTYTASLSLEGDATYRKARHEWGSALSIVETLSRSPAIPRFIKANDQLHLETAYFFHVNDNPQHGPFVLAALDTALFAGSDNRASESTYRLLFLDGTTEDVPGRTTFATTDAFRPMLLKQSLGYFIRPITESYFSADLRAGAGAREVIAADQYAVTDDGATAEIELTELQNYQQLGTEVSVALNGAVDEGRVTWSARYETLTPFVNSISDDPRGPGELTNHDIQAALGFRLTSWASLDYNFRAQRIPALVEDWQITNALLLTLSYILVD
jgi:hypothetical protein